MTCKASTELRPNDPTFLFALLLWVRENGDRVLESRVSDWLTEQYGITVTFGDAPVSPIKRKVKRKVKSKVKRPQETGQ